MLERIRQWRRGNEARPSPGPQPAGDPSDEVTAQQWLCDQYPQLKQRALRYGWAARLEAEVAAVRAGGSASQALRNLRIDSPGDRGPSRIKVGEWSEDIRISQRYQCPYGVCQERGRNGDATEPRCHLSDGDASVRPSTVKPVDQ